MCEMTLEERKREDVLIKMKRQPIWLPPNPISGVIDLEAQVRLYVEQLKGAGFEVVRFQEEAEYCILLATPDEHVLRTCAAKFFNRTHDGRWKTKVTGGKTRVVDNISPTGIKFKNQDGKWERMIAKDTFPIYFRLA